MIQKLNIDRYLEYRSLSISGSGRNDLDGFPFLSIDTDSYINDVTVQTEIDYDVSGGRHCIAIGKYCSLAHNITFLIDRNHDYGAVVQGNPSFLERSGKAHIRRKGSIILQNDVWIGHGATILSGVTLHNGCVVAANAVVTKDIPPYAIAGGNPAKVLRYRFDQNTIMGMQKIAWWDWDRAKQISRKEDFALSPKEFVEKYLPEADAQGGDPILWHTALQGQVILLIPDVSDPFPLYPRILDQYFETDRPDTELLIYLPKEHSSDSSLRMIKSILDRFSFRNSNVTMQTGVTLDENVLFQIADYYVTTRSKETVRRTCLADLNNVSILYGTDDPIFAEI